MFTHASCDYYMYNKELQMIMSALIYSKELLIHSDVLRLFLLCTDLLQRLLVSYTRHFMLQTAPKENGIISPATRGSTSTRSADG